MNLLDLREQASVPIPYRLIELPICAGVVDPELYGGNNECHKSVQTYTECLRQIRENRIGKSHDRASGQSISVFSVPRISA